MVPALHDGVIILNGFTDDAAAAHAAGEDDETARRFGWWPEKTTEAGARNAFANWARNWETGGPVRTFAARDAVTGRLVGGCELRLQPDGSGHVSYWTSSSERRRGYATRVLALLLDYAGSIGITRLESHVAQDNLASRRVSEKNRFCPAGTFTDKDGISMIRYQLGMNSATAQN
jgi:RimJ/RimL family protein N-acetyltransferase